ncbi:MAG: TetR/AcrR family transcriptional regulator [Pseudomonadota bacterium]
MTAQDKQQLAEARDQTSDALRKERYHHGDLRECLIEATRRLVEDKGADKFSVSEACRLAGVSTAAPYKHFRDRNDMLVAMVIAGMMRHRERMFAAIKDLPSGSPLRIKALGQEYVDFALNEPGVFRLKFGGYTDRLTDPQLEEIGQATFEIVLREVAACLGQTDITADVRQRGFMLWSFVHGLSFLLHDQKLSDMGGDIDLDFMLGDIAERILRDV